MGVLLAAAFSTLAGVPVAGSIVWGGGTIGLIVGVMSAACGSWLDGLTGASCWLVAAPCPGSSSKRTGAPVIWFG
jgi:hypothetical protein